MSLGGSLLFVSLLLALVSLFPRSLVQWYTSQYSSIPGIRRDYTSDSRLSNTMGSQFDASSQSEPFKVLVLGGCYAGLSAALNLIDLSEGRAARQGNGVVPAHDGKISVHVTIVDERDGYCTFTYCCHEPRAM